MLKFELCRACGAGALFYEMLLPDGAAGGSGFGSGSRRSGPVCGGTHKSFAEQYETGDTSKYADHYGGGVHRNDTCGCAKGETDNLMDDNGTAYTERVVKSSCCRQESKKKTPLTSMNNAETSFASASGTAKNMCEAKSGSCGIHNYSEIGKLRRVLLHRIGEEIEGLVPDNFERLLFDDIPYLKVAQEEHDCFANLLRENGVEVIYYVDETEKALADKDVREDFIRHITEESHIYSEGIREAICAYLSEMPTRKMIEKIIAGVKKSDIQNVKSKSLADYITSDYPYYMDPMPNLYFTRDPGACVGNGINIHHMSTAARRREALLLEYMFKYNKDFAPDGTNIWYDYDFAHEIEGGDVLVLSSEIVAIGYSQRTSVAAIEKFAENALKNSTFKKVLVFDIPKCRAFMHLDTVFTMVDYDKFTIHPEIEGPLQIFEITLDKDGKAHFTSMQDEFVNILKKNFLCLLLSL